MADRYLENHTPLLQENPRIVSSPISESKNQPLDDYGNPIQDGPRFQERRPTAIKNLRSRKQSLLQSLLHIPPIAITLGVISLSIRGVFWQPPSNNTNVVLNSLQFAAQLHGSLIVSSLAAMLLHLAHHEMAGKKGVQVGFAISSFQLNSLGYLFRKEFTSLRLKYMLICLLAFTLSVLSGPSSAIVMLPRLEFWPAGKVWPHPGNVDFRVFIEASAAELYPDTLTGEKLPPLCLTSNASLQEECPTFGMRQFLMTDDIFLGRGNLNKTIQGDWIRYMVGDLPPIFQGTQSSFIASSLSNFLGRVLFAYDSMMSQFDSYSTSILGVRLGVNDFLPTMESTLPRYDLSLRSGGKTTVTRKPVVSVECAGYPRNASNLILQHDMMIWPPWTESPYKETEWSVPASTFSNLTQNLNSSIVNSSWINIEQFGDVKPSLGAFFAAPEVLTRGGNANFSQYACTIDARWMETHAFLDTSQSGGEAAVFDSNPDPNDALLTNIFDVGPRPAALPGVLLFESWVEALDVPFMDSISKPKPTNRTILDTIGQKCIDSHTYLNTTLLGRPFSDNRPHRIHTDPTILLLCFQRALSIYITDAIARTQDSIPTYFVIDGQGIEPDQNSYYEYPKDPFLVQSIYQDLAQSQYDNRTRIQNITKADLEDPARFTEIVISLSRWGYGWGFYGSILIFVGAGLLLAHVALVVGYLTWLFAKGAYRSAGWNNLGDLVSMALRSGTLHEKEPLDKEAEKRKWRQNIGVREVVAKGTGSGAIANGDGMDEKKVLVLRKVGGRGKEEDDGLDTMSDDTRV